MLSKKAKYALKALLLMAAEPERGPILISEISRRERIPRKFLELILLELRRPGILESKKGRGGGYSLARPPAAITFGQVIRVIDGPLAPVSCVSQMAYRPCSECLDEDACAIKVVMQEARDALAAILDDRTLADALRAVNAKKRTRRRPPKRTPA